MSGVAPAIVTSRCERWRMSRWKSPKSRAPGGAMSPRRLVTANRLRRARTSRSTSPDSGRTRPCASGLAEDDMILGSGNAMSEALVDGEIVAHHPLAAEPLGGARPAGAAIEARNLVPQQARHFACISGEKTGHA